MSAIEQSPFRGKIQESKIVKLGKEEGLLGIAQRVEIAKIEGRKALLIIERAPYVSMAPRNVEVHNFTYSYLYLNFGSQKILIDAARRDSERRVPAQITIPQETFAERAFSMELQEGKPVWEEAIIQEQALSKERPITLSGPVIFTVSSVILDQKRRLQFYGEGYSVQTKRENFARVCEGGRWELRVNNKMSPREGDTLRVAFLNSEGKVLKEGAPLEAGLTILLSPVPAGTESIRFSLD